MLILYKKIRGSITPSAPSFSIPIGREVGDPWAIKTAENPCFNNFSGLFILLFVFILIPKLSIQSISLFNILFGNLYDGIAYLSIPPAWFSASKTLTEYPILIKSTAADKPAGPAPIIAIFSLCIISQGCVFKDLLASS